MTLEETYRSISPELLAPSRPSRLVLYAFFDWTCIALCWWIALQTPAAFYPLWVVLIAGRLHALGALMHELVHLPHATGLVPGILEVAAGFPIASTIAAMRYHHLRHHRHNGLPQDPYFKPWIGASRWRWWLSTVRFLILFPAWVVRALYGTLAVIVPRLRNSYGRWFLQDRSGRDLTNDPEVFHCARRDVTQFVAHLIAFTLGPQLFPGFAAYYFIPAILAGYLAGCRLLAEHNQEANANRELATTFRSTNDHHLGFFYGIFLTPHNLGYHRMHHLHPQASFECLPQLSDLYRRLGDHST